MSETKRADNLINFHVLPEEEWRKKNVHNGIRCLALLGNEWSTYSRINAEMTLVSPGKSDLYGKNCIVAIRRSKNGENRIPKHAHHDIRRGGCILTDPHAVCERPVKGTGRKGAGKEKEFQLHPDLAVVLFNFNRQSIPRTSSPPQTPTRNISADHSDQESPIPDPATMLQPESESTHANQESYRGEQFEQNFADGYESADFQAEEVNSHSAPGRRTLVIFFSDEDAAAPDRKRRFAELVDIEFEKMMREPLGLAEPFSPNTSSPNIPATSNSAPAISRKRKRETKTDNDRYADNLVQHLKKRPVSFEDTVEAQPLQGNATALTIAAAAHQSGAVAFAPSMPIEDEVDAAKSYTPEKALQCAFEVRNGLEKIAKLQEMMDRNAIIALHALYWRANELPRFGRNQEIATELGISKQTVGRMKAVASRLRFLVDGKYTDGEEDRTIDGFRGVGTGVLWVPEFARWVFKSWDLFHLPYAQIATTASKLMEGGRKLPFQSLTQDGGEDRINELD